ncbi:LuxR C-terminal-related transcriptional regulator [Variovorax sp. V118]|uniref:helix-turn-helix transcriptional regulator n=1 Tax=Variovorax sp. V118 TaxID=3065954 RepID=UPI0034E8EA75
MDHMGQARRLALRDRRPGGDGLPDSLAEFAVVHEIHHAMGICLDEEATGQLFFLVLYRGEGDSPFTDGEAVWFQELSRHVVQLWYFNLLEAISRVSDHRMEALALVRADGHLLFTGGVFCELLYELWPDWDGVDLPEDLVRRLHDSPCMVRLGKGALNVRPQGDHFRIERMEPGAIGINLSPRERRVAHLFAAGMTHKEIGRRLSLSPATVRTYLRQAYIHLCVRNKVELNEALS